MYGAHYILCGRQGSELRERPPRVVRGEPGRDPRGAVRVGPGHQGAAGAVRADAAQDDGDRVRGLLVQSARGEADRPREPLGLHAHRRLRVRGVPHEHRLRLREIRGEDRQLVRFPLILVHPTALDSTARTTLRGDERESTVHSALYISRAHCAGGTRKR